jgi:hypothetical protein
MIAAATAAPGLRNVFPKAKAPAACWATQDVKKTLEATNIQDIPNPTDPVNRLTSARMILQGLRIKDKYIPTKKGSNQSRSRMNPILNKESKHTQPN